MSVSALIEGLHSATAKSFHRLSLEVTVNGAIIVLLCVAVASSAQARTIYVGGLSKTNQPLDGLSWQTAWTDVGTALKSASAGDEIWVAAGTYSQNSSYSLPARVALYGGFQGTETNRAQRDWSRHPTVLTVSNVCAVIKIPGGTNDTRIDGFTITGGYGGIVVRGSPVIANNRVVGNISRGDIGACGGRNFVRQLERVQFDTGGE